MSNPTELPLEGLQALVDLAEDGACLLEPGTGRIIYANARLRELVDSSAEPSAAASIFRLIPQLQTPAAGQQLADLADGKHAETRIDFGGTEKLPRGDFAAALVRRVETPGGLLLAMILKTTAVAGVDPLTGLSDRADILARLSQVVRGDRSEDLRSAVLFVDVDGFKQVNDSHGHLVGDAVLREVARRLAGCVRTGDHVARFGGDEFLVLLENVAGAEEIEPAVRRIRAAFARPIALSRGEVTLGVSIGAAQAGVDGRSPEALIDAADRAMYAAKHAPA